jgi:hypothetical protein
MLEPSVHGAARNNGQLAGRVPVAYSGLYIANRSCHEQSNLSLQRRGLHGPFALVYCTPYVRLFTCPRVQKPGLAALGPLVTRMTASQDPPVLVRHPGRRHQPDLVEI